MKNVDFTIKQKATNRVYFFLKKGNEILITSAPSTTAQAAEELKQKFLKEAYKAEGFKAIKQENHPTPHGFILEDEEGNFIAISKNFKHKASATKFRNRLIKYAGELQKATA